MKEKEGIIMNKIILAVVVVLVNLFLSQSAWGVKPMIATGTGHSVALKDDGTVLSWR